MLIGYFSNAPDGFLIGAHAATVTGRLKFLLAHRPGFMAPTVAARKLATLDQLTGGRTVVHLIAGGNNPDQARDGYFTDHDTRYRRIREYVTLLQRTWTEPLPFDHEGEFYRVVGAYADNLGWGMEAATRSANRVARAIDEAEVAEVDTGLHIHDGVRADDAIGQHERHGDERGDEKFLR